MRINTNIMAMNTQRQLSINNGNQAKSTEKLSSGYRINRAADDAAGLSISEKMRGQIRGLNMASKNAQDGVSLIQSAEGALNETHAILQRMRELAVQAANGVNAADDKMAIAAEISELKKEIDRIAETTEFNTMKLLNGNLGNIGIKTSGAAKANVLAVGSDTGIGSFTVKVDTAATKAEYSTGAIAAFTEATKISITGANGETLIQEFATGEGATEIVNWINNNTSSLGFTATQAAGVITFTAVEAGSGYTLETSGLGTVTKTANTGTDVVLDSATFLAKGATGAQAAVSAYVMKADPKNGNIVTFTNGEMDGVTLDLTGVAANGTITFDVSANQLTLQVGANEGQTMSASIQDMSSAALGIQGIDITNQKSAGQAITAIDDAIKKVSSQRSLIGAIQNRLEHTIKNLDTVSENLTSAESRIRDIDMAKEMMTWTTNNILSQAATAMLAQANQAPQTVLQLLR